MKGNETNSLLIYSSHLLFLLFTVGFGLCCGDTTLDRGPRPRFLYISTWIGLTEPSVPLEACKCEADAQCLVLAVVRGRRRVLNTLIHGLLRNPILK
ncbi:hypothetical protein M441DRAFT_315796 [Trichoderma asperellum CBS 433.97]|uniref:Uncharacterized protein n=1 Tax=Trichoderma asperellum (strain ATCC 204424 / CBS 433.97 / NBRC 101777) TaxID=1042311 RepID=A0A2T3ZKR4_TRIA4|nr:hypothetical protein M441DRAFT_315796 [Trichoderma asperellum CBS 433.97]PTB45373.1 hypothetical protein M441DRAFT_315796 [Trichoderma asperellum CBS 433.97]